MSHFANKSLYRRSPELVSSYIQIPENVNTFDFDTCFIDECFVLKNITGYIFKKILNKIHFNYDEISLTNFISSVCEKYNKNHYQNIFLCAIPSAFADIYFRNLLRFLGCRIL